MKLLNLLFLLLFSFTGFHAWGQEKHPFSAEDLVRLDHLFTPEVSPDGGSVAYVLRETDMEANQGYTDIWVIDLKDIGAGPRRLTNHEEDDAAPQWSKDGKSIYFLSARTGAWQIWVIPLAGGEARQVSAFPVEVTSFKISTDGSHIAFTAAVYPDCLTLGCSRNRAILVEKDPEKGLVYDQHIIRYWDKWRTGQKSQLMVAKINQDGVIEEEPWNVTKPLNAEVPAYSNEVAKYVFSADGRTIYFSTKLQGRDESWSVNYDIYKVPIGGRRAPENLTSDNLAVDEDPVISPNGKWLAWRATEGPERWAAQYKIKLMNLKSGEVVTLGGDWDRSPVSLTFTRDSNFILALSDHLGERVAWRVPLNSKVDGGVPELLAGGGQLLTIADSSFGVVFDRSDLQHPANLYLLANGAVRQLTNLNAERLASTGMGDFEQFSFTGAHGDTVYGYVVHPVDYSRGRKYPVALIIHGGPHASMGNYFSFRWNPQTYAGAGYAVVFIDFHGSTGYGQDFVESIHGDRGGAPLTDHRLGLSAALEKFPWLDGERVCALGASFGGYMVNLIEGAWPRRFRCLVNHDGMFDNRMKYYSGDIIGYLEEGFGGRPYYEDPANHEAFNPVLGVDAWQTPMLVIHSEKDYRVPITQGIGAFTALQRRGIPSRFLYFPDENHWVIGPANSLQWHREVLRWLDQWLKP